MELREWFLTTKSSYSYFQKTSQKCIPFAFLHYWHFIIIESAHFEPSSAFLFSLQIILLPFLLILHSQH